MNMVRLRRLSLPMIWQQQGPDIWKAEQNEGQQNIPFYPIYRYEDCYSYHPLFLVLHKGFLHLNEHLLLNRQRVYYSGTETIDRDISRLGSAPEHRPSFYERGEFVAALATAMVADIGDIESTYPEHHHIILCGGKDSLNILLLPWRRAVTAYSAEPNYPLVREFVARNDLPIEVVCLEDADRSTLDAEILFNMNQNDLRHYRWTAELKHLAGDRNGKVIFWKGQLADTFLTPHWRTYGHYGRSELHRYVARARNKLGLYSQAFLVNRWMQAQWRRGAMWQGFHMSFLRGICGALFLSAYHGPRTAALIPQIYPPAISDRDIRPDVGKLLAGRNIWYPPANPRPPESAFRSNLGTSSFERFLDLLVQRGVRVDKERAAAIVSSLI